MSDYWTEYWKHGHLTSFGDVFKNNYPPVLAESWQNWFKQLSSPATIVDIGTGNGALIDMALGCVSQSTRLLGLDAASLSVPERLTAADNVSFIENTKAEKLPFESASVSTVISQFGLEYADLKQAIPEVIRVLSDGGAFRFVTHVEGSAILQPNVEILKATNFILQRNGVIERIAGLVKVLHKQGAGSVAAEKARTQLNEQLGLLMQNCRDEGIQGTNIQQFLKDIMKQSLTKKVKLDMLSSFKTEMLQLQKRLADLTSAALSQDQLTNMKQQMLAAGCDIVMDKPVVIEGGNTIAWCIEGSKGSA